jgi:ABC-type proline/glycine betaine transport system ATPase subunit
MSPLVQVIKDKFASCTVLTVAHRIHTIIDADTVLCFDAGRLMGRGSPHGLLQDPGSVFRGLVEETGEASASMLRQRAAEKCARTRPCYCPLHEPLLGSVWSRFFSDVALVACLVAWRALLCCLTVNVSSSSP